MLQHLTPDRLRDGHGAKWTAVPRDVIPAWVADMDLGFPEPVADTLRRTIDRQDLGYPYWPDGDPVVSAFSERMQTRYDWSPRSMRTRVFSDLIQILQIVIELTTAPGDAVALQVPTYPPFLAAIQRARRRIVALPFDDTSAGWAFDLDHYHELLAEHRPRLLVLVNPHNPTGRAFTRTELRGLAQLALEHTIPVFADEIHADLTYAPRVHIPFASLDSSVEDLTITATSATKAFNLAGTRCAVAHFGHRPTWEELDRAPLDYFGTPSVLSRAATVAAWEEGQAWLQTIHEVLAANRSSVRRWAAAHPDVRYHEPEATYLSWFDFTATGIADDPARQILDQGRVQLSPGDDFAQHTDIVTRSYARLNFATTPETLDEILERLTIAYRPPAYQNHGPS